MWQLFHSFSLYIIQPLLESFYYHLIDNLNLSIPLWINWGGIPIRSAKITTIPLEGLAVKLKAIVRDEGMRDPKSGDNIFLNKSLGIHVPDICQWFSFNPLDKVICGDQQPSLILCYLKELPYNI